MTAKEWFTDFARGTALGVGMLPGASAGTIGIIVNVYDKLITNLANLRKQFWKSAMALIPIFLGWIIATVILLYAEKKLWDYIPFIIVSLCAGITVGGLPVIFDGMGEGKPQAKEISLIATGFIIGTAIGVLSVLAYVFHWFSFDEAFLNPNANWYIYIVAVIVGAVAAVACIIPGISGAMILFIFGLYNPVLDIFIGDNSILHNHDRLGTGLILIACLVVGVVVGMLSVSGLLKKALSEHKRSTYSVVLGFVLGSLVSMFVNNQIWPTYSNPNNNQPWQYIVGGLAFLIAAAVMFLLVKRRKNKN
ncbi:MAG: DUF368 domain-containing protein [Bacilli bacterium]|nr:DUF368 domain-containing protein [Bacilli bacterium]